MQKSKRRYKKNQYDYPSSVTKLFRCTAGNIIVIICKRQVYYALFNNIYDKCNNLESTYSR